MKYKNLFIIFGVILLIIISIGFMYNRMMRAEEQVTNSWADVESTYQRRADLIPSLVKTVQGVADFEKSTLESVIDARSNASSIKIDPTNMTEANLAQFQKAQNEVSSALNRLMVVVERYPELKATQSFQELQTQLEGTENRINVARNKFNAAVKSYNVSIRRFPRNIFANMFGFERKAYFKSDAGAEKAPDVDFNF